MHAARLRNHGDLQSLGAPGPTNHSWVGDEITYHGMHLRVRYQLGAAGAHKCTACGSRDAEEWAYDNTDPNEHVSEKGMAYSTEIAHYRPLCRSCHRRADCDLAVKSRDHGNARLTRQYVREIRKLLQDGRSMLSIAHQFDCGATTVARIRDGRTWRNVV